ncbi:EAL domain-containing protein [Roseateles sp. P5_E1]
MKPNELPPADDVSEEIARLIESFHAIEQRLEELTGGEVDTVTDQLGRTSLLRRSQEHSRHNEAVKQAAILDALPAHIAVLDAQGSIVAVNEAWRCFATANALQGPRYAVGVNYLKVCDDAIGDGGSEGPIVSAGIRAVLMEGAKSFSIEYPCDSTTEQRWFLLTVTPLAQQRPNGVVVMHLNITEQKIGENRIGRLNRVYAMLSGINALIVRARGYDELFREASRLAVDLGAFKMAWIGVMDPLTLECKAVASHGSEPGNVNPIPPSARVDAPSSDRPACRALRSSQPVICNDIESDLAMAPFRAELRGGGYRSFGYFPLTLHGQPWAVMALFSGEAGIFDAQEMQLLQELAGDISFALDHIEKLERLEYLAYFDVLTGLANRTLFLDRVTRHLLDAVAGSRPMAVFLLDLERFKNINDSLGQVTGDELLRQVAAWLVQQMGDAGLVARIGSDRFAAVLPRVKHQSGIRQLLEQTLMAFLNHSFPLNEAVFRISVKVGVAVFPDDGASAESLFKNAEAALKKAKSSGDRYLFYTPQMTASVASKLALENQLRQALENEEFVLHYQPKVDLRSGLLTGAEALIRWNDPRTGLVPPTQFIPILEETGLIYEVGRWALRSAVSDYLRWRRDGFSAVRIAVNVSPLQLRNRDFIAEVEQAISIDPQAAAGLELEITESLIMEDVLHSISSLRAIRAMGVRVAIDDFGTGFSSLSYLSKLPVDTLKIDRSFVVDMTTSSEGLALVSTIITLAHSLKLNVVAEGVETEAQRRLLQELVCNEMQGYLFSRPLPCDAFEALYLDPPAGGADRLDA